jgi:hypothetical protein
LSDDFVVAVAVAVAIPVAYLCLRCTSSHQQQGPFAAGIKERPTGSWQWIRAVVGRRCWHAAHPTSAGVTFQRPRRTNSDNSQRTTTALFWEVLELSLLANVDANSSCFALVLQEPPPLRLPPPHPMLSLPHSSKPEMNGPHMRQATASRARSNGSSTVVWGVQVSKSRSLRDADTSR